MSSKGDNNRTIRRLKKILLEKIIPVYRYTFFIVISYKMSSKR